MNEICFTDRHGRYHSKTLGTNDAASALLELFAVGYAAGTFPESARARRFVHPARGAEEANPGGQIAWAPTAAADVKQLIRLNGKGCFWVEFEANGAASGYFQHQPDCEIYSGVLVPLLLDQVTHGHVAIPAGRRVEAVSKAWNAVLPRLEGSPAIQRLKAMA